MPEFGGDLDAWLEAPYVDAARRESEFDAWCQTTDTDPESEGAWEKFDAFVESQMDDPEPPEDWDDND